MTDRTFGQFFVCLKEKTTTTKMHMAQLEKVEQLIFFAIEFFLLKDALIYMKMTSKD